MWVSDLVEKKLFIKLLDIDENWALASMIVKYFVQIMPKPKSLLHCCQIKIYYDLYDL